MTSHPDICRGWQLERAEALATPALRADDGRVEELLQVGDHDSCVKWIINSASVDGKLK